jgi:hypothetical protein
MGQNLVKYSYWLCICPLLASLLGELALMAQLPAAPESSYRAIFVAGVTVGVLLFSNFARYVGAVLGGYSGLYILYNFIGTVTGPFAVSFALQATMLAVTALELMSAYLLGLSRSFSKEFREKRASSPAVVARARLLVLILLAVCVAVKVSHDVFKIVTTRS